MNYVHLEDNSVHITESISPFEVFVPVTFAVATD